MLTEDKEIAWISITAFGQTKSTNMNTGELAVPAFENNDIQLEDNAVGYAYDQYGQARYELKYEEAMGRWVWE